MPKDRARRSSSKGDGRNSGGFVALPWVILDSPAFIELSHPAKALLLEFARQHYFSKDEGMHTNGRLLATSKTLSKRGWKSGDTVYRAKQELIKAGFLYETVKGCKPNKASWYALTWFALPLRPKYDFGAAKDFIRWSPNLVINPPKIKALIPSHGVEASQIAPPNGVESLSTTPPHGAITPTFGNPSTPSHGNQSIGLPSATRITAQQLNQHEASH